ncbi:PGP2 [Auxenochlorella protothecoides x Auxenochlorella symbiontica]
MAMSAYIMKRQANALSWARLVQPAAVEAASCAWHPACLGPDSTSEQRQPPGVPGPWTVDSGSFLRRAYSKGRPHAQHGRAQERRQKGGTPHGAVSVHIRDFDRPTPVAPSKPVQAAEPAKPSLVQALKAAGWSRQEVLNVPNALSMARMVSGPAIGWWIVQGQWDLAAPALAVSAASDWLDGLAARKLDQQSVLGSYLDPIADKVLIGSVTIALTKAGSLPVALAFVIVGRDVGLVAGGALMRARQLGWRWPGAAEFFRLGGGTAAAPVSPLLISKINTVLQLGLVGGCALQGLLGWPSGEALLSLGMLTAGTTIWSAAAYARAFLAAGGKQAPVGGSAIAGGSLPALPRPSRGKRGARVKQ